MSYSVAIAGASGYAGGELLRLIAGHPQLEVKTLTAHSNVGQKLYQQHPNLRAMGDYEFVATTADNLAGHDIVFLALPHGKSGELAAELEAHPNAPKILVDCGADHRLSDSAAWDKYYGGTHFGAWAYAVPELPLVTGGKLREQLVGATRIGAPGCNASLVSLAFAPAVFKDLIETTDLSATLAVGPSGAGKALKTHLLASEILGSANPYAVGGVHRHIPEIGQNLALSGAADFSISFVPVIVPMSRGILATCTARLKAGVTEETIRSAFDAVYADEEFITVLPAGEQPRTADVLGSNSVHLSVGVDASSGRLVVIAAVDNLTKGTAGAAIQSVNIALGLQESLGLSAIGVAP
ncbi:MAG: N-acetyl-gamma-glutamyl-phosphate reductase [Microbacteriaceae bacterium]